MKLIDEEFLGDRRKALEEAFFARENERLRRALEEKAAARARREALAEASGITDEDVLAHLDALDIGCDALSALSLLPLVEVAWADGDLDDGEREAILAAAHKVGVDQDGPAAALLRSWLANEPPFDTLIAWKEYVSALCRTMDEEKKQRFNRSLLGRSRAVAKASGGVIGFGDKVSASERTVLSEIEDAFL
ncbi:MAG: hypothetical protein R3174_05480 [Gammaproteobacteria bacterium]|nr:hypothetical protein [Gammaproteobacteria bacterium]